MTMTAEEFLEHHGVKGMKWGVRKGRGTTGITRSRGALIDRNDRLSSKLGSALSGEKYRTSAAIGKSLLGSSDWEKKMNQRVEDLHDQNDRVRSGNLAIRDRLDLIGNTSIANLVVSRRPHD